MKFTLAGPITDIEIIAVGSRIRELDSLRNGFGPGRWRKLKGVAMVEFVDGTMAMAEIHWYEASGIGRRRMKVKRTWEER